METKQFPEKWAVRAYDIDLTQIEKYINNSQNLFLDIKEGDDAGWYFTYDGDLGWARDTDGYTEVTLEELIAHYESKKMVRCIGDNGIKGDVIIGKCYSVLQGNTFDGFSFKNENNITHFIPKEFAVGRFEDYTHPKWMPLTKGDNKIIELKEVFEHWVVKALGFGHKPIIYICDAKGINIRGNADFDLIPYNPRINELEEKITSKRSELAELEGELKELKK